VAEETRAACAQKHTRDFLDAMHFNTSISMVLARAERRFEFARWLDRWLQ